MGPPEYQPRFTIEEYLALKKETGTKYEYHDGEVYAMAGGTPTQSLISNNVGTSLNIALRKKRCFTYNSDLRIATSRNRYVYPDVVVCGKVTYFEELKNAANNNLQDSVQLHSLDVQLSLEDIYLGVAFVPFDEENWKLI